MTGAMNLPPQRNGTEQDSGKKNPEKASVHVLIGLQIDFGCDCAY
jgi:hypothetical protein